ncbi:hypothetical protein DPMN_135139 [Dreissena polymorpha]|uniref:Uncharacterized protein n=1 Tax=Dreissena polymorpha TaxID=45954 RepID=A0A9D4JBC4_DREPO|nr:hypothetical protein DPMN_135139 [Dreissena polymorpha]
MLHRLFHYKFVWRLWAGAVAGAGAEAGARAGAEGSASARAGARAGAGCGLTVFGLVGVGAPVRGRQGRRTLN